MKRKFFRCHVCGENMERSMAIRQTGTVAPSEELFLRHIEADCNNEKLNNKKKNWFGRSYNANLMEFDVSSAVSYVF